MSCPVNLQALPAGLLQEVVTPETVRGRTSRNSLTFPKSRCALWDGSCTGDTLRLQLCSHRKPRVVLLDKALRLAQRHVRQSNKRDLQCFFLGTVSVDSDEEGVTMTLDRFDPGRDQTGSSGRVPTALLPGDIQVPCLFSSEPETTPDTVVQSEAELRHCFKLLQQFISSKQTLDLSQMIKVRGRVVCTQLSDATAFRLSWLAVFPSDGVDVQPVRAIPIIPTALLRSLTSVGRPLQPAAGLQRGFLTMDQTRKLLLLLESDPKASKLPLVGLWLSGVTHIYNPQVLAWCLRFLFSSALLDRVLSESRCFLLVLFAATHRAPQFFQCQGPGPGLPLDFELLTASQCVTLYQMASVDRQALQCELALDERCRQMALFREARDSFSRAPPPAAGLSVSDQDSGVEDEDLSPRPSPSPHPPTQQTRRVQPSVPEVSLLIDSSFNCNQRQDSDSTHRCPPPATADKRSAPPTETPPSSSSSPAPPARHHLHSTPHSNLLQPCSCCADHTYNTTSIFSSPGLLSAAPPPAPSSLDSTPTPPSRSRTATPSLPVSSRRGTPLSSHQAPPPTVSPHHPAPLPSTHNHSTPPQSTLIPPAPPSLCSHPGHVLQCDDPSPHPAYQSDPVSPPWLPRPACEKRCCEQVGGGVLSDTYQLLLHQDQQLRLLQAQVQMLLEAQGKINTSSRQVDSQTARTTTSTAVETGASLFWAEPVKPLPPQEPHAHQPSDPPPPLFASSSTAPSRSQSPSPDLSITGPVALSEDRDMNHLVAPFSPTGQHSCAHSPVLGDSVDMLRPADSQQSFYHNLMTQLTSRLQESERTQQVQEESRRSLSERPSSSSTRKQQQSPAGDPVVNATLRQLQQLGVDLAEEDLMASNRNRVKTVQSTSTLASINPAAVVSRLNMADPSVSSLEFPGGTVDLSLEANAIALQYLRDSHLNRLSLGGHTLCPGSASSTDSLVSPSNISLDTRKYMRRYGLVEEEYEDDEEEQDDYRVEEPSSRQPLTEALNMKLLPQSQLIRDLQPKMQALARITKPNTVDKENRSGRQPSLGRESSHQPEGSVGNILDLSRLRQLPKLF